MEALTEDKFWEVYKPQINHFERAKFSKETPDEDVCSYNGCMYETYGEDLDYVWELANKEKRVWTILQCDDDEDGNCIVAYSAGFHLVNREGYFITEKPWETEAEEVVIVIEMDN